MPCYLIPLAIVPEFRIDDTRLEPTGYTYSGIVDYMIPTRGVSRTGTPLFHFQTFSRPYRTASEVGISVSSSPEALILQHLRSKVRVRTALSRWQLLFKAKN